MIINWGDYAAARSASITLTPGIDPDELSIEIGAPLAGNTLAKSADFTIDDEQGGSVTLYDMRAIDGTIQRSTSNRIVRFRAHDRRWRWSMTDPISGDYNNKDAAGVTIDNDFKKSANDLGEILLDAMGESGYVISGLPTDQYPETSWDSINPAQALQDLTDLYSALITISTANIVVIYDPKTGSDELPQYDQQITARDETQRVERIPAKLIVKGGFNVDQIEIELTAVGFDPLAGDFGEYSSMDLLSWKPLGGFYPGYEEDLSGDSLDAARETGFKYYRLPALIEVDGVDTPREQVLKYISDEIAEVQDNDGNSALARPYCTGIHATELSFSTVFGYNVDGTGKVPVGFRIDKSLGMLIFDEPVFGISGNKMVGAEINLQVGLKLERFEAVYDQPDGLEGTSAFVNRPELRYLKINGAIQNPDVRDEANKAAEAIANGFVTEEPKTIAYTGIAGLYAPDGLIEQVTFSGDIQNGPMTTVSWKTEHDNIKPTRVQRKAAINAERTSNQAISGKKKPESINDRPNKEPVQIVSTAMDQKNTRFSMRKIVNTSGVAIPAGSFLEKDGVDSSGYVKVKKPTEANMPANKLIISTPLLEIPSGGRAIGIDASTGGASVKYSGTAPTSNQDFGTQANSFEGLAGNTGFTADGVVEGLAYANPFRGSDYKLLTTGTFDKSTSGTGIGLATSDSLTITNPITQSTYKSLAMSGFDMVVSLTNTGGSDENVQYQSLVSFSDDGITFVTDTSNTLFEGNILIKNGYSLQITSNYYASWMAFDPVFALSGNAQYARVEVYLSGFANTSWTVVLDSRTTGNTVGIAGSSSRYPDMT